MFCIATEQCYFCWAGMKTNDENGDSAKRECGPSYAFYCYMCHLGVVIKIVVQGLLFSNLPALLYSLSY